MAATGGESDIILRPVACRIRIADSIELYVVFARLIHRAADLAVRIEAIQGCVPFSSSCV